MLEVYMTLSQNPWNIPVHGCSWACECPENLKNTSTLVEFKNYTIVRRALH